MKTTLGLVAGLILVSGWCSPGAKAKQKDWYLELQWTRDANGIEVTHVQLPAERRKRLDLKTGEFLPMTPGLASPGGNYRVVVGAKRTLRIGTGEGKLSAPIQVPGLLDPSGLDPDARDKFFEPERPSAIWWATERELVWCEQDDYQGLSGCTVFDTAKRHFRPLLVSSPLMFFTVNVQRGPGDWLVIYSAPEGHLIVELKHFGLAYGSHDSKVRLPSLYDSGPLRVHFDTTGQNIWFVTPCLLSHKKKIHPCMDEHSMSLGDKGLSWRLYQWSKSQPEFVLMRADLPPRAVPDPEGMRFAWTHQGKICIGDPQSPLQVRCHYLPEEMRNPLPAQGAGTSRESAY